MNPQHTAHPGKPPGNNNLQLASGLLFPAQMKFVWILLVAAGVLLGQDDPDLNINSRYTIERIGFVDAQRYKLSSSLLDEMHRLIGAKVNEEALKGLVRRIRTELRAYDVTFRLDRGHSPDSVAVLLEVKRGKSYVDLVSIPQFVYNTRQGWSGTLEANSTVGSNSFRVDVVSDGDTMVERVMGVRARYDRLSVGSSRVHVGFEFDAFQEQYNEATLLALENPSTSVSSSLGAGAYGSRMNFEPSAAFVLAEPLTLTVGASFERMQPDLTAARPLFANAVINTLRYHRGWGDTGATRQELDAGYNLRAATKMLGTDLGYTRHLANLHYRYGRDHQMIEVAVVAGAIYGHAPLFERFVLGDSTMLRGWNKYDIDPVGGNRIAYGSVTYGYHIMRVFYDTGSVWDQGNKPELRQSAGIGISGGLGVFQRGAFLLAVAFPLRQGRVDPVLIAGMNF